MYRAQQFPGVRGSAGLTSTRCSIGRHVIVGQSGKHLQSPFSSGTLSSGHSAPRTSSPMAQQRTSSAASPDALMLSSPFRDSTRDGTKNTVLSASPHNTKHGTRNRGRSASAPRDLLSDSSFTEPSSYMAATLPVDNNSLSLSIAEKQPIIPTIFPANEPRRAN